MSAHKTRPFEKVLVANRGEIALRIIRACREMGFPTVAVHSTADEDSLHVRFADESVCIGPPSPRLSYLNIPALMSAAEITGADAIHPGYGFLSESSEFAGVCETCDLVFIGPAAASIHLLGDKIQARAAAKAAGIPLLPGSDGFLANADEARELAEKIGLPVILKAAAGGGGRGMKIIRDLDNIAQAFAAASAEAESSFGNGAMFLERYVEKPRHIEIQIVADNYGEMIHLGERECSVQRRHQKLIEEAPSTAIDEKLRQRMGKDAVRLLKSVGYRSLGTVEFLLDEEGRYYFMEVNTRIQVEHPVTEEVTGIDLAQLQLFLAAGEHLPYKQQDIKIRGHAIECRITAEDAINFAPSPGKISAYHVPGGHGVRVDDAVSEGSEVLPTYDSLIAKLIVHARSRDLAIARMRRALGEYVVEGVRSAIPFHMQALAEDAFVSGHYDTSFVQKMREGRVRNIA